MNKLLLSALALSAALWAGCHGGAYAPVNTTKYDLENKANFVDMDSGTQRSVSCSGIELKPLVDGRLEVTAHVRNRLARRIQVQINCVFKNAQGFSTGDETPWQNLILTEKEQQDVKFISMTDQARTYTIRVRQAR